MTDHSSTESIWKHTGQKLLECMIPLFSSSNPLERIGSTQSTTMRSSSAKERARIAYASLVQLRIETGLGDGALLANAIKVVATTLVQHHFRVMFDRCLFKFDVPVVQLIPVGVPKPSQQKILAPACLPLYLHEVAPAH